VKKLEVVKMKMLRWLTGTSLRDRKTNEETREKAGVMAIAEKCREGRLHWFGHVEACGENRPG
jgi:hypothetical protein